MMKIMKQQHFMTMLKQILQLKQEEEFVKRVSSYAAGTKIAAAFCYSGTKMATDVTQLFVQNSNKCWITTVQS